MGKLHSATSWGIFPVEAEILIDDINETITRLPGGDLDYTLVETFPPSHHIDDKEISLNG